MEGSDTGPDGSKAEENTGSFGKRIRALQPDIVIDLICFTLESARHLAEALRGEIQHYLFMSYQPQPSLCADMRKKWRTGLVRKQFCSLNIGMNGKKKSRMRKLQLLGITLLTAQIAAFQKQSGCCIIDHATAPWKPSTSR